MLVIAVVDLWVGVVSVYAGRVGAGQDGFFGVSLWLVDVKACVGGYLQPGAFHRGDLQAWLFIVVWI